MSLDDTALREQAGQERLDPADLDIPPERRYAVLAAPHGSLPGDHMSRDDWRFADGPAQLRDYAATLGDDVPDEIADLLDREPPENGDC